MRRIHAGIILVCLWLLACSACAAQEAHTQFVYGQSELGRDLVCHRVGREDAEHSLLMIFGIHGYEDAFDRDGEVLKMIAERLIGHYSEKPEELQSVCLYIIPCANPDGLLEGNTWEGFGRSNASGIDINRDFSSDWSRQTKSRNRTGRSPFSTAEARAIRDLVLSVRPDYAMDVHGWSECSYGNGEMARVFAQPFGLETQRLRGGGMACAWLNTVTEESMLRELPSGPDKGPYVTYSFNGLKEGISAWTDWLGE